MKPGEALSDAQKQSLDYETVLDCHFVTPRLGEIGNVIRAYCRRCKKLVMEFTQEEYDKKSLVALNEDTNYAQQEMVHAWLEHDCERWD